MSSAVWRCDAEGGCRSALLGSLVLHRPSGLAGLPKPAWKFVGAGSRSLATGREVSGVSE